MPDLIRALQGDLAKSDEKVTEEAEQILLPNIDLASLVAGDRSQVEQLTKDFVGEYLEDIRDGITRGHKFAKTVLKNGG